MYGIMTLLISSDSVLDVLSLQPVCVCVCVITSSCFLQEFPVDFLSLLLSLSEFGSRINVPG